MHRLIPGAPVDGSQRALALVRRLRVVLPAAMVLVVLAHQAWETATVDYWPAYLRFTLGALFYGLAGPLATFFTLDWIAQSMAQQAEMERLVAANRELQQLDALKDEFVDLVSHELRAPLTNISASVELLLEREEVPASRRKLEIIGQETARLTGLVQGVLDVSRIHAGRLDLVVAPVEADVLCRAAVARVAAMDGDRALRVIVAPDTPPVLADAERAGQVLGNLLENAIKYSPAGTPVDVDVRAVPDDGAVVFAVTDRGAGIPPEERERIFERFHRVERGDDRATYGHGLGLYIARRIVERHGGRIWVTGAHGRGTTFLFTLPAAPEEP